jgi:DnaK suppressor protein
MAGYLDHAQLAGFRRTLREHLASRREEVRQTLLRSDDEQYHELAGGVHDLADQSLADVLVDVNLAEVDRQIDGIRAIEAALLRIAKGGYGVCSDCGGEIGLDRLHAEPASHRCTECQALHERTYVQLDHPKL